MSYSAIHLSNYAQSLKGHRRETMQREIRLVIEADVIHVTLLEEGKPLHREKIEGRISENDIIRFNEWMVLGNYIAW